MVVPHLRCRSQCFEFMRVEVDVQPDREDAERDDAAVEVAAHLFFASLSRGLLRERCLSPLFAACSASAVLSRRCGQDLVCSGI